MRAGLKTFLNEIANHIILFFHHLTKPVHHTLKAFTVRIIFGRLISEKHQHRSVLVNGRPGEELCNLRNFRRQKYRHIREQDTYKVIPIIFHLAPFFFRRCAELFLNSRLRKTDAHMRSKILIMCQIGVGAWVYTFWMK